MTELKTIDELMAGKAPDSLKISMADHDYFRPFFQNRNGDWFGLDRRSLAISHCGQVKKWKVWEEPKPEEQLWWFRECGNWFLHPYSLTDIGAENMTRARNFQERRPSGIKLPKE